jgi:hypothetical protein
MICAVAGQMKVGVRDLHVACTGADIPTGVVLGNLH